MVGLPARGKSFIVKKLARYLNWVQHETRVFNAGERRRKTAPTSPQPEEAPSQSSAAFFDPDNPKFVSRRDEIALGVLDDLLDWVTQGGGSVGILDATNSTRKRRELVLSRIRNRVGPNLTVLFLESCCFDEAVLRRNFQLKLSGPDYKSQDPETALHDFKRRVALYEKAYDTLGKAEEEEMISYAQLIDVGRKMNTHLIRGFLSTQVVEYMLGFNLSERQLWISCGGESLDDAVGRIGRRSALSENGNQYAAALARFIQKQRNAWEQSWRDDTCMTNPSTVSKGTSRPRSAKGFCIWTSMMPQTTQTASVFPDERYAKTEIKLLDDLNAGDMAGLTFKEIAEHHPDIYAARKRHRMLYRWPGLGGESYADLIHRLKPVIVEVERMREHLLLISHRAVVRVLLAYYLDLHMSDLPEMVIPKNWAFLLEPVRILRSYYKIQIY
jgi:6-phosphofructo-2-kinase